MSKQNNIEVKVVHEFSSTAEEVFDAWIKPEILREWYSIIEMSSGTKMDVRKVEIDARVGGRWTFSDMREGGEAVHWGFYKVIDRPNKLVFTFFTSEEEEKEDNSTVTMVFTPTKKGCRVELTYEMGAQYAEYTKQTEHGWVTMLTAINKYLSN